MPEEVITDDGKQFTARIARGGEVLFKKVPLGRINTGTTVTVHAAQETVAIDLPDGDTTVVRRANDHAVRSITGQRPRTA